MADEPEFEPVADDATAAQPSTPGAKLRAAREAQGLSVQDIATRTRIAQRQLVEILKATSRNAKLVLMDEPTSALTGTEIEYLFKQIKRLNELGITIIYISHKLDEIFRVCSDIPDLQDLRRGRQLQPDRRMGQNQVRKMEET